jgi:hypothetical protein
MSLPDPACLRWLATGSFSDPAIGSTLTTSNPILIWTAAAACTRTFSLDGPVMIF